jgi:hypothetical protein
MIIKSIPVYHGRRLLARFNLKIFVVETYVIANSGKNGQDIVGSRNINGKLNINPSNKNCRNAAHNDIQRGTEPSWE